MQMSEAVSSCPTVYAETSSVRSSAMCRRGVTPALAKCPATGLVTLRGSTAPNANCTAV